MRGEQEALRARCQHPSGVFEPFPPEEAERSVAARFATLAARHPARTAIETPGETLTYGELDAAANRVARAVLDVGDGAVATPVVLLLDNGAGFVTASLGAFKAGAVQVPLDPRFPAARLAAMLDHAGAGLILTAGPHVGLAEALAAGRRRVLELDRLPRAPAEDPGLAIRPEAPAKITYTSGSTGTPKGIVHSQRSMLHTVARHTNTFRIGPQDRLAFLRPGASAPLYALLAGASCYPVNLHAQELPELAEWLIRDEITVLRAPIAAFRAFAGTLQAGQRFPQFRLLIVFGERARRADVERVRDHVGPGCLLASTLGCREAGDYACFFAEPATGGGGVPAALPGGYPLEGVEVLVLDAEGRPLPDAEAGELAVRSGSVALGYWERPDLTAAAFLPDPAGGPVRIYRTGDVGRRLADGLLLHLGRRDLQVKVRGHRVDLGEVEAALLDLPGVAEAAAGQAGGGPGGPRLVAYLVPGAGPLPSVDELRRVLGQRLPGYMVPSVFVHLEALPRTPNGKVDRRALPAPEPARPELGVPLRAPESALEAQVATLFGETLGVQAVGRDDGFFDLGGDSLLALRLVAAIERRFGRRLPLATLLEAATPAALARILDRPDWTPPRSSLVAIQPEGTRSPLFCVPGHAGTVLCFRELARHLGPEQPIYGLEPVGLDGRHPPQSRIEDMAERYLRDIRGLQPRGPYHVAGYCLGGLVALEMARRLRAEGQTVGLLALFDTVAPQPPGSRRTRLDRLAARLGLARVNLRALSPREGVVYAALLVGRGARRLGAAARRLVAPRRRDPVIARLARAQHQAAAACRPVPYDGPVVLYKAQHPLSRHVLDPAFGWASLVPRGLETRLIPSARGSAIQDPAGARLVAQDLAGRLAPV
jgi:amino acid adenylation domain-containing protein